jgi:hypothetical protein
VSHDIGQPRCPNQKRRSPDCIFSEFNTQPAFRLRFAIISDAQDKTRPSNSLLLVLWDSYIPCFMPISLGAPIRRRSANL